ncbi:MAG: DUF3533 domain-containing protein [Eggerthellaceae bacterium]
MFEKLGKRKYVVPFAILLLMACFFSLMFYPMAHMELKDLPFAMVSLDEGVETSEGDVNIGSLVADNITQATGEDGQEMPLVWKSYDSQEALDQALANNELYGAIVVPADFSQSQYDQLVETMQEQIDNMQGSMSDMMSGATPASGLSSLSSLGASSATPSFSSEAQAAIAAAQQNAQGVTASAATSAQAFKDAQAKVVELQQQYQGVQQTLTDTESKLETAKARQDELSNKGEALTEEEKKELEELAITIPETEKIVEETKSELESLQSDIETATKNAENAQTNMSNAQNNAKTAMVNAVGVQKTATASSMLAAQASMLSNAVSNLKTALGSLNASSLTDRFSGMSETVAAKAFVSAADSLESGSAEEENDSSAAAITVYLNMGKSPMIANTLQTTMKSIFAEAGFSADIVMVNEGVMAGDSDDAATSSPMSTMMSQQIAIIPIIIISSIVGLLLCRIFRASSEETTKAKASRVGKQLLYAAIFSLLASLTSFAMLTGIANVPAPEMESILFMWLASFGLVSLIMGLGSIAFPLGVLAVICAIPFGMMLGVLPYEALPTFWQEWVYPWAPQRFFGEGLRSILFMGQGAWNGVSAVFAGMGATGVALCLLSILKPNHKEGEEPKGPAALRARLMAKRAQRA